MSLHGTTSQTIGPYLRIGLEWMQIEDLAPRGVTGERLTIRGRVLEAARAGVSRLRALADQ
jgi:hypothetical protein